MKAVPLKFCAPVCLVGGGALTREMLDQAMTVTDVLIAADGAADRLADWGLMPAAVIGDMDSIQDADRWQNEDCLFVELPEQDSTDFGKCLYATQAPLYLAAGFTGRRIDHMLAAFSTLLEQSDKTVILIGETEVAVLVPPERAMDLKLVTGAIVSIYPLLPVTGTISKGLEWPIKGLSMQAGVQIGTSNRAIQDHVQLGFDGPGALLMLERQYLGELVGALTV